MRIGRLSRTLVAAGVLAFGVSGCYHATIDTGRTPSGTTIQNDWAHSFVYGLVPPSTVNTASQCPSGVARVETQHSFLNGLVAGLTWGLYTPITITVQCAGAAAQADLPAESTLSLPQGATAAEISSAMNQAVERASDTGEPVFISFPR